MAAGSIFTVLSNVPWGQVIEAAPAVAEGASKLWKAVRRRGQAEEASVEEVIEQGAVEAEARPDPLQVLNGQVAQLQSELTELREEMQTAAGLIKELAEQNTALVQRIELNRRHLRRLAWAAALAVATLAVGLGLLAVRLP